MSHIVSIKQRGVSFAYSRGSGSEAVALALRTHPRRRVQRFNHIAARSGLRACLLSSALCLG